MTLIDASSASGWRAARRNDRVTMIVRARRAAAEAVFFGAQNLRG
jgi:hypothetical protein